MNRKDPYTAADLIRLAIDVQGPQPLDPLRVVATYANPHNWESIHASDERGPRHYWAWRGPVIVGYELAGQGIKDTGVAQPQAVIADLKAKLGVAEARVDRVREEYAGLVGVARKSMYPNDADKVTASVRRVNTIMRGDEPGRNDGWWPVLDSLVDTTGANR